MPIDAFNDLTKGVNFIILIILIILIVSSNFYSGKGIPSINLESWQRGYQFRQIAAKQT
tara:strand:+ start:48 stop:224 length:177 start_codon:yes stop_codon:yes gene_type:complete